MVLLMQQPFLQSFCNRLRFGIDMKFFVDVIDVGADSADADVAVVSYHFIAIAINEALQDHCFFLG